MKKINNSIYNEYGERWYTAENEPIALLRRESLYKNMWVEKVLINEECENSKLLDIACGAGYLSNYFSKAGYNVSGVDISQSSLDIAKKYDESNRVDYSFGDAKKLPYPSNSFDVVCIMDFLEHTEDPDGVINEASRVLRPGGLLFYNTFNRNFMTWFLAVKALEWFVRNPVKNIHVYRLFIRPKELINLLNKNNLSNIAKEGLRPKFNWAFFKTIIKGKVEKDFQFIFNKNLSMGYIGYAKKTKEEK